jgi:hypothetical protein
MAAELLSCPYCNASIPVADPAAAGPRVQCPRCQELFPNRRSTVANGQPIPALEREPSVRPESRPSNRWVAACLLGAMAAMALIALGYALWTKEFRRGNDFLQKDQPTVTTVQSEAVPPQKLSGLGYLPPGTDVVLAVQVAALLRDPNGRELLNNLQFGTVDVGLSNLEKWTGLKLDEIDHAVLGLTLEDRLLPRVTLVVETRRPYSQATIRDRLKASRRTGQGGRELYRFKLEKTPFEPALWFAGNRTLVGGLMADDLNEVPDTPAAGPTNLPEPVQALLKERPEDGVHLWLGGHVDDWRRTVVQFRLETLAPELRESLGKVRTFGASLQLGDAPNLRAVLDCADDAAAESLYKMLPDLGGPTANAPPGNADRPELKLLTFGGLFKYLSRALQGSRIDIHMKAQGAP